MSWTHFRALIPIKNPLQRDFYTHMCRIEAWSVKTLRSKIDGMLFERTAISRKPEELIKQELKELTDNGNYGYCEVTEVYHSSENLIEIVQSDGTNMTINWNYAEEHFSVCDSCGKYHEDPLTQVENDEFICNECLRNYEFVEGNYVLNSGQVA